jgi:hypothetical protein
MRTVGFYRDFTGYSGGHGKMFDYFEHTRGHPRFVARIHLAPGSLRDDTNPWRFRGSFEDREWRPERYDALFLGGMDWQQLPAAGAAPTRPTLNLIQHVRHGDPGDPRFPFLSRPAIRICVSPAVAEAILASGRVNGPVHVIPAGVELPGAEACEAGDGGPVRVVIAAHKGQALGRALAEGLRGEPGLALDLCTEWLPRQRFLERLGRAQIAVAIPHEREGFFLPGLEAMALGKATVVPDCLGNRAYARDGENCLMPAAEAEPLAAAVRRLGASGPLRRELAAAGLATARSLGLAAERAAYHALLDRLDAEWASCRPAS